MVGPISRLGRRLAARDPGLVALREASQAFLAAVCTFAAMGIICRLAHQPQSSSVLGVVVTIMASRALRGASGRQRAAALVLLPLFIGLVTIGTTLAAGVLWISPVVFVVTCFAGTFVRRFGDTAARFGRLAMAPLLAALLTAPPTSGRGHSLWQPCFTACGCFLAVLFCCLMQQAVLRERPVRVLRAALQTLLREGTAMLAASTPPRLTRRCQRRSRSLAARRLAVVRRAAAVADHRLQRLADRPGAPGGGRASLIAAVFDTELAAEELGSEELGSEEPGSEVLAARADLETALEMLSRAVAADLPQQLAPLPGPDRAVAARPRSRRFLVASTRTAIQLSAALILAYLAAGLLHGRPSSWIIITAFVVSQGVRSREDVVSKGLRRIAGALAGTVAGTVLAASTGDRVLLTAAVFCLLYIGVTVRAANYAFWVFCVTSILALLYKIMGFSGTHLLELRVLEIAAGTVCGILPAYLLVPVSASDVAKSHTRRALDRLRVILKDTAHLLQAPAAAAPPEAPAAPLPPAAASLRQAARDFDRDVTQLLTAASLARSRRRLGRPWRRQRSGQPAPMLGSCGRAVRTLASAVHRVPVGDELSQELLSLVVAVQPSVTASRNKITKKAAAKPVRSAAIENSFAEFTRRLDTCDAMPTSARRGYELSSAALQAINESLRQLQAERQA